MAGSPKPGNGRAPEEWARAYRAFLLFVGLVLLILLAKGLYLVVSLLAVAVVGAAALVRSLGKHLR